MVFDPRGRPPAELGALSISPPSVAVEFVSRTQTAAVFNITGALGANALGVLQWRWRTDTGAYTAWSSAALPQNVTVNRLPFYEIVLQAQVMQPDGQIASASLTVNGQLPYFDPVAGHPVRSIPFTDGWYPGTATTPDGLTLHVGALDSNGAAINRGFRKTLSTDPNTLDGVPEGTTFVRTTPNEKTGAGRGFTAIDSGGVVIPAGIDFVRGYTNKHLDNIPDGTTYQRVVATALTSGQPDLGKAGVVGRVLTNIADDATFRRTGVAYVDTSNRITGAHRTAGGQDITADLLGAQLGAAPQNLLANGGGQDGPLTGLATGWTLNTGVNLTCTTAFAQIADRSLTHSWTGATDSSAVQSFTLVTGAVYALSGWVKLSAFAAGVEAGGFAYGGWFGLTQDTCVLSVLDRQGGQQKAGDVTVGVLANGVAQGFTFVQLVVYCVSGGASRVVVESIAGATGQAWYDGIVFEQLPPSVTQGGFRAWTALDGNSNLTPGITQSDGIAQRVIAKGHIAGLAQNGAAISFATNFQNPPMILLNGGINYEPRAKWNAIGDGTGTTAAIATAPQYDDVIAYSVLASGFHLRARLRQKGTPTARTNNFPAGNLTTIGNTSVVTLANAPAADDRYTATYTVSLDVSGADFAAVSASATIAFDDFDGGLWNERSTVTYTVSGTTSASNTWIADTQVLVVGGLNTASTARLRVKALSASGQSAVASLSVTPTKVTYNTSASDQYASKTPDADDMVAWDAIATS